MGKKKITIATLYKFEIVQEVYELSKGLCISSGVDEKAFLETDAKIAEIRANILEALKGGISNNVKSAK